MASSDNGSSTGAGRERHPYRLNAVIAHLRELARDTDGELETVITEFAAAVEADGVIETADAHMILLALMRAFRNNAHALNILNLLDESGSEAAVREVERHASKRKRGTR